MRANTSRLVATAALAVALLVPGVAAAIPSVPSTRFSKAEGCGCHAALLEQWSKTMHSQALSDPLYLAKLDAANRATDGGIGKFCEDCHGPVAAMAGMTGKGARPRDAVAAEGVACDPCHQFTGTAHPPANASWAIQPDGTKRAQLEDASSPAHATAYSAYHESAEFCGACHNVNHPVNGLPLEATYTEWKASPYAAQGVTCQDCHMTPGAGPTKPNPGKAAAFGPDRAHIYTMTFAGGNVALGDAELATERLRGAATLELEATEFVEAGGEGVVRVTVTNSGAGHYLPTGLTEIRECWLQVKVATPDGASLVDERRDFHTVLKDAKGRGPVDLWDAAGVLADTRIPPKESKVFDFDFRMPEGASKLDVAAALYYSSAPEELAKKAEVEVPTTEMARLDRAVFSSEEAAAAEATRHLPAPQQGATPTVILVLGLAALGAILVGFWLRARAARRA